MEVIDMIKDPRNPMPEPQDIIKSMIGVVILFYSIFKIAIDLTLIFLIYRLFNPSGKITMGFLVKGWIVLYLIKTFVKTVNESKYK